MKNSLILLILSNSGVKNDYVSSSFPLHECGATAHLDEFKNETH